MGKFTTYMIMMAGLVLLFHFTGLTQQCDDDGLCEGKTPNSDLLGLLLSPDDMPNRNLTDFSDEALLIFEGLAAVAISVGFFVSGKPELALVGPFAIFFFNLGWDILFVIVEVSKENPVLAILIFSPLLLVFITTIIEWWRGIST